jgi:protease-4
MARKRWMQHRPLFSSQAPAEVKKPRIKWRVLPLFWLGIKKTCTVIGAFVLICVLMVVFSVSQIKETAEPPLPAQMVLYLEFTDGFSEIPSSSVVAESLGLVTPTVHEMVDAIDLAVKDDRVKGIMARMDGGSFPPAQSVEVREALKRFRAAGKFTKIYSSSFGESGGGLGRFYLASVFEDRWMQPLGVVAIPGVSAEMPFLRGTLDKIGVKPEFMKRKDYKTAYENLTDKEMSQYNREEISAIISDMRIELTKDISGDLKIPVAAFDRLVNKGLFTSKEALSEKLITTAGYVDVLVEQITEAITGDPESEEEIFVDPKGYLAGMQREQGERNMMKGQFMDTNRQIAIVYVTGLIMDTNAGGSAPGFGDEGVAAADEIGAALMDAADDETISAVILRVDSPGGSPVASETILRAAEKVQQKGKPVIVSMGSTAASGGYWVAANADRIFATPTTLTGSIGVVGGKFSVAELSGKLGVNWQGVQWGENAGLWGLNKPFSDSEAERMNAMLDQVYDAFLDRVAKGRHMTIDQVDKIAGGRVWSGASAIDVGLVDELGGLEKAEDYTAKLLGAENRFGVDFVVLPKPLTAFEEFMAMLGQQGMVYEGLKFQAALGKTVSPVMNQWAVLSNMDQFSTYEPLKIH